MFSRCLQTIENAICFPITFSLSVVFIYSEGLVDLKMFTLLQDGFDFEITLFSSHYLFGVFCNS